ncbi:COG4315 family predicted lipoprotein [Nocardiopsis lambiniae]|uniref:Lipoprotein with Yx(FWY)xxD motif n=1 Tax=Nocardiopsis lambiniae TaxID=3075539 RepID=A0ABU2M8J2_9ACTN|nr:hypothetical protein [Nocardiopsis sp. DSM 44743]MDT0328982.1 hypothetical protein [Nocardiopsis sp. DSM 44743]
MLGTLITDGNGNTLYLFTQDSAESSACTGECAQNWVPLRTSDDGAGAPAEIAGDLSADLVGSVARDDGDPQVTYGDRPLYTYTGDAAPGDVNGQGVGDTWFAVTSEGAPAEAAAGDDGYGGSSYIRRPEG